MKTAAILLLVALAGCSTKVDQPVPSSPKPASLESVSSKAGQIDTAVSASVQVAREMNKAGRPDKVEGELSVAAANLPKADDGAVALARLRAEKATSLEYEEQRKKAQAKAAEMEKAWAELHKQAKLKDDQIRELKLQVESHRREIWSITGAGLVVIGGLVWAFASWKMGAPLLLAGAFCSAIPYTIESPFFTWTAGGTLACCSILFVWWIFDKVRDNVNENEPAKKKVQNR